jgi:hypothetical protein
VGFRSLFLPIQRFSVSGLSLEQWILKTLIALAFKGDLPIGDGDPRPGAPAIMLRQVTMFFQRMGQGCRFSFLASFIIVPSLLS